MLAVGGTNLLETYLSPEKYTGTEWRLMQHVTRDYPTRLRWAHQLLHEAHLSATRNRADNASYLTAFYHFEYDWHRRLATLPLAGGTISLKGGPGVDALAGMVYSTRNGNNPAQAHLALAGAASFVADYALPRVEGRWRWIVPASVRYELQVPLVGLQFSPRFGQSYYEIFTRGNYDHNVVPTWVGNAPSMRQMLTVDYNLWGTTLRAGYLGDYDHNVVFTTPFNAPSMRQMVTADFRISAHSALRLGYRADIQQSKLHDLKFHEWSHLFVLGFVKSFTLTPRHL